MTETEMLRAQVDSLTKQLVAAVNDAARAELRARDAVAALKGSHARNHKGLGDVDECGGCGPYIRDLFAANPDSDARLREVVERAFERGRKYERNEYKFPSRRATAIDEVLRGGA